MQNINAHIGNNIKEIRKSRGLTIDKLSLESGVSKGMISEIERGVRNPSINTLWSIANTLKIPINYILKGNNIQEPVIYKIGDKLDLGESSYSIHTIMNFNEDRKFEIYFNEYKPNSQTKPSAHYDGVEEYALITCGQLTLSMDGNEFIANEGEVIYFKGNNLHSYINNTYYTVKAFLLLFY
ncbi:helix-turn-helix domain-containing protein (plasmid) [Paraclostridium ghonii]|uniref:helix-turn-helix domain-containing protein n=1 Tax=Paraclostridium ghonii TaxID=29358 RepID=UPI00202CD941|nr:helix-turn-helix transcriptional regulator [Paeniclostridium ghonii]MCM0167577.1 helix-turn-helix domain-containing protein [Paeniclostridium ghonii]